MLSQNVGHYLPRKKAQCVSRMKRSAALLKSLEMYKDEVKMGCHISSTVEGALETLSVYAFDCISCMKHILRDLTHGSFYEIGGF